MKSKKPLPIYSTVLAVTLSAVSLLSTESNAQQPTTSRWYYSMGGANSYSNFSGKETIDFSLGASARWNIGNACSFDPSISIKNYITDLERSVYALESAVLGAATSIISGYALDAIQRANPGLYDLLTKNLAQASAKYEVAVNSCKAIQEDISAGNNPFDDWIQISRQASWTEAVASGDSDPVEVEEGISQDPGNNGVPWVGGLSAGGVGQSPIQVVEDTITVGYNYWAETDSRFNQVFPDATSAVRYAHTVIGETTLRTCSNCQRLTTRVALGIKAAHRKELEVVREEIVKLVDGEDISDEDLAGVSAIGMGILLTQDIITGLRLESANDRAILMNRLADEIALQRQVEKMLMIRHILQAARQDPNVAVNAPAVDAITRHLSRIQEDLDGILWERAVRQEIGSSTAAVIAERYRAYITARANEGIEATNSTAPLHGN